MYSEEDIPYEQPFDIVSTTTRNNTSDIEALNRVLLEQNNHLIFEQTKTSNYLEFVMGFLVLIPFLILIDRFSR